MVPALPEIEPWSSTTTTWIDRFQSFLQAKPLVPGFSATDFQRTCPLSNWMYWLSYQSSLVVTSATVERPAAGAQSRSVCVVETPEVPGTPIVRCSCGTNYECVCYLQYKLQGTVPAADTLFRTLTSIVCSDTSDDTLQITIIDGCRSDTCNYRTGW